MHKKKAAIALSLAVCALALFGTGVFLIANAKRSSAHHREVEEMADQACAAIEADLQWDAIEKAAEKTRQAAEKAAEKLLLSVGESEADVISLRSAALHTDGTTTDEAAEKKADNIVVHTAASEGLDHHIIFVGDSRTVGMGKAEAKQNDACLYIGESGEGYYWFLEEGIDLMQDAIRSWPESPVVYNLGVNDCDQIWRYLEIYRDLEKAWPETTFYYMSVNPVTTESAHVPNADVIAFNRELRTAFPDQYLDTFSWMSLFGYESVDGVHYSEEQYCKIHDYTLRLIRSKEEKNEKES